MKVTSISHQTFNGYKNVFVNDAKSDAGYRFSFIAMQLDNNQTKDLEAWQELMKGSSQPQDDILTAVYLKTQNKDGNLFLGNRVILAGDKLAYLRKNSIGTQYETLYKQEEKFALKAYTLLASLTSRIATESLCNRDADLGRVFQKLLDVLTPITGNSAERAFEVINISALKNLEPHKVAMLFNRAINNTMRIFFK